MRTVVYIGESVGLVVIGVMVVILIKDRGLVIGKGLYKKDLVDRQLKISELAYGSDKANALFRDMLMQASTECDFDAENIPLMIEAIPLSPECLVLLITKVNDPEELDTRFSSFTRSPEDDEEEEFEAPERSFADEIISCFNHLSDLIGDHLSRLNPYFVNAHRLTVNGERQFRSW